MANKDLRRQPHTVSESDDCWWYEEPAGIEVYIRHATHTTTVKIKWAALRAALRRKDKRDGKS